MQLNVDIIFVHKSVAESCFRFPDVPTKSLCAVAVVTTQMVGGGHSGDQW